MADTSARPHGRTANDAVPAGVGRGTRVVDGAGRDQESGDEHLIALAREGSAEAFEELWLRHAAAGRRVAARFTRASEPDDLVQEAYLRILAALQKGKGPDVTFRPYLYQTIRNIAITWAGRPVEQSTTILEDLSDGSDMSVAILERSVTATAFRSLPGRWQAVLWYSEVEDLEPAEIAPLLGIKAGAVSALAYRAREGLRRAWLQVHVNAASAPPECTWVAERMGDANRGALRGAAMARFDEHVDSCDRCVALVDEVSEISRSLGPVMVPIVLGVPWGAFADGHDADAPDAEDADPDTQSATKPRTSSTWKGHVAVLSVVLMLAVAAGAVSLGGGLIPAETITSSSAVVPLPTDQPARAPGETVSPGAAGAEELAPPPDVPTVSRPAPVPVLPAYPTLWGTAQPGMTILIEDAAGRLLAEVIAGSDGEWSATLRGDGAADLDGGSPEQPSPLGSAGTMTITARAVDTAGRSSETSAPSTTYSLVGDRLPSARDSSTASS